MSLKLVQVYTKVEFKNKWNDQVDEILNNGVSWIDKEFMWEKFSESIELEAEDIDSISDEDLSILNEVAGEDLHEILVECHGNIMQEII